MTEPAVTFAPEQATPDTPPQRQRRKRRKPGDVVIRRMIYRLEPETVEAIRTTMRLTHKTRREVFAVFLAQMRPQELAARTNLVRRVVEEMRLELDNIARKAAESRPQTAVEEGEPK